MYLTSSAPAVPPPQFNACEKEEEDWVTLRNELEAKEEEQQEAAAAAAGGNGGTGAGGLHWIEKEVISASVVPDQQAKLTQVRENQSPPPMKRVTSICTWLHAPP